LWILNAKISTILLGYEYKLGLKKAIEHLMKLPTNKYFLFILATRDEAQRGT